MDRARLAHRVCPPRPARPRVLLLSLVLSVTVGACSFPKTAGAPPPLTPPQIAVAATKFEQSLVAGHNIFVAKCNGCHGYPDLGSVPENRWPEIMKTMTRKADLKGTEGEDVLHFILAARTEAPKTP
jgi:mono/diheme cytochrome c family protein